MKKVIVLAGPTASGKTSLSIKIAKALNLDVINGDSVAIYKRLDVGSAKITNKEMDGVKHHLLSVVEPGTEYSVYNYQKDLRDLIKKIDIPFIVGGSGFYIKSSLYNYEFHDESKSKEVDISYEEKIKLIKEKDPKYIFDESNHRRVDRAYEMILSGLLPSTKKSKNKPLYDILLLYLDMPRDKQEALMYKRVDKQIEDGFIEEVTKLREDGIIIRDIIGYRELNEYLDGSITLDEAKEKIVRTSFQFSKRQRTWFKNQMNPVILDPLSSTLVEDAINIIKRFIKT
jgi:tRNA dimethylallyltransferase